MAPERAGGVPTRPPSPDRAPGTPTLVGREEELDQVVEAIGASAGCVIAGPAGIGKSRLAAEAARATASTGPLHRVVATTAAASLPFGTFAHLLPARSGSEAIPAFVAWLRDQHADGPPTLLVDDAHLLDHESAALLHAVAATSAAQLLVTVRSLEPTPDAIVSLWKERSFERIDLQPLSRADTRALVDALLGSPSNALVYARIHELTQGNPLYVAELVAEGRRTDTLAMRDQRWRLDGESVISTRLDDLIGARVRAVSEPAHSALEVLAIGAPLPLDRLLGLVAADAVEELERAGLVVISDQPELVVELAHPLYGEVVAARTPATVGRRVRRELAAAFTEAPPGDDWEVLRPAAWLLEAGGVDPDLAARASAIALRRGDPALAERLAEVSGPGLDGALARAHAKIGMACFDEAEEALAPHQAEAAAAEAPLTAVYLEARFRALLRGSPGAPKATAFLDEAAGWYQGDDWAALIATQRAWAALYEGRPRAAYREVAPILDRESLSPARRFHLHAVAIYAGGRLGLVDDCEHLDRGLRRAMEDLDQAPWEGAFAAFLTDASARLVAGRDLEGIAQRVREALARAEESGNAPLAAVLRDILGTAALRRGHVRDALSYLTDAFDSLAEADPLNHSDWTLCSLAEAQVYAGEPEAAAATLGQVEATLETRPNLARRLRPELGCAQAWVEAGHGRLTRAREILSSLAGEAGEDLEGLAEATYGTIRLGGAARGAAAVLERVAAESQNELWAAYASHARALADHDHDAQLASAEAFEAMGIDILASEAATLAAHGFAESGRRDPARRASAIASRCWARCQGAITPARERVPDHPELTAREREAAALAARGLTNAEIAEQLVLSVRTVEAYVLRACRKLGVSNRQQLARVLGVE